MRTEKTLMLATMEGNPDEIADAVINCINDHLKSDSIRAEDLPQAEAELLILLMRSKSVGENVDINVIDPETEDSIPLKINLTDINIEIDEEFSDLITLKNGHILKFQLPGLRTMENMDQEANEFDTSIEVMKRCLLQIIVDDEAYNTGDLSSNEVEEYLLDLDSGDFYEITNKFLSKMPSISYSKVIERADGTSFKAEVSGLASFL